jgi:hypothetical protein
MTQYSAFLGIDLTRRSLVDNDLLGTDVCIPKHDDLDKRWLYAVAAHDKQYVDLDTGWRAVILPTGQAWIQAARVVFDQAKEKYSEGFAACDDVKRLEAIKLLETLTHTIHKWADPLLTKPDSDKDGEIGYKTLAIIGLALGGIYLLRK